MLRVSLTNRVTAATIISASTEDTVYVADNAATPQRPFKPWKTTTIGSDQDIVIDFGSAAIIEAVGIIRTNFATVVVQGNATNAWGGPSYTSTITVARNPWNTRYQHGFRPVAFNYRFMRVAIPTQATLDGASVFSLGGVWAGTLTTAPRDFSESYTINRIEPRLDVRPGSRAWTQRLTIGEPRVSIRMKLDVLTGTPPAKTDLLADWLGLQRQMNDAAYFLALLEDNDPAQSYIVQSAVEPTWQVGGAVSTQGDFTFEEMLGP
jgi:hypothetical protein